MERNVSYHPPTMEPNKDRFHEIKVSSRSIATD